MMKEFMLETDRIFLRKEKNMCKKGGGLLLTKRWFAVKCRCYVCGVGSKRRNVEGRRSFRVQIMAQIRQNTP